MTRIAKRFRGFLPVVVDVETGGFNAASDALLECAAICLQMTPDGIIHHEEPMTVAVRPFAGANLDSAALEVNGIVPDREEALEESEALIEFFAPIRRAVRAAECTRAVLVGHNAHFDLGFLNAAALRCKNKHNPFHPFSCFDTATLGGLAVGETVLAKACRAAGLDFDDDLAHGATYDAHKTAQLFCWIINRWREFGGWPPSIRTV